MGSLAGSFLGGWLSGRIGSTNVQKASLFFSGVFFIWLGQLQTPWAINSMLFVLAAALEKEPFPASIDFILDRV